MPHLLRIAKHDWKQYEGKEVKVCYYGDDQPQCCRIKEVHLPFITLENDDDMWCQEETDIRAIYY